MKTASMPAGRFVLATLATWRVTHLLAEEDGPADVVVRLRRRAGSSWAGSLLDCFYCLSVWVAVPFCAGLAGRRRVDPVTCLAVSGAACLLEQATRRSSDPHHDTHSDPHHDTHSEQEVSGP